MPQRHPSVKDVKGHVAGDFHTLLDAGPFLPEKTWHGNRTHCRAAGIQDDVVYRPKWEIALEEVARALLTPLHGSQIQRACSELPIVL